MKWIAGSIALLAVAIVAVAVIVTRDHKTCTTVGGGSSSYATPKHEVCK
jgi:hypothetical protein